MTDSPPVAGPTARLNVWSGIGLVIANTVGVGVLTCTGFMARDMAPTHIVVAWIVGSMVAMAGAYGYSAIAAIIPRSGGEYRYLSDLIHPVVGYLAGWASLLVGFSAPVAVAAYSAGCFAETLFPQLSGRLPVARIVAAGLIVLMTVLHAVDRRWSQRSQDFLATAKFIVLIVFIAVGLALGANRWPTWQPAAIAASAAAAVTTVHGFPVGPFFISLVYIAYAYTGWNTSIYAADEFHEPRKTVPRTMILGTATVAVVYMAVNWVFLSNLSAARLAEWNKGDTDRVTLAHFVTNDLAGATAAQVMSILIIVILVSSISAMTLAGPRVYSTMARDGYLPRLLADRDGRPPIGSVMLQSGLALILLATHSFETLIRSAGALLTLMSALTVLPLFYIRFMRSSRHTPRPGLLPLAAAGLYLIASAWMLYFALRDSWATIAWVAIAIAVALACFFATRWVRRSAPVEDMEG